MKINHHFKKSFLLKNYSLEISGSVWKNYVVVYSKIKLYLEANFWGNNSKLANTTSILLIFLSNASLSMVAWYPSINKKKSICKLRNLFVRFQPFTKYPPPGLQQYDLDVKERSKAQNFVPSTKNMFPSSSPRTVFSTGWGFPTTIVL